MSLPKQTCEIRNESALHSVYRSGDIHTSASL
jgi:hypothetical protein